MFFLEFSIPAHEAPGWILTSGVILGRSWDCLRGCWCSVVLHHGWHVRSVHSWHVGLIYVSITVQYCRDLLGVRWGLQWSRHPRNSFMVSPLQSFTVWVKLYYGSTSHSTSQNKQWNNVTEKRQRGQQKFWLHQQSSEICINKTPQMIVALQGVNNNNYRLHRKVVLALQGGNLWITPFFDDFVTPHQRW
jgi:hypothetical protein